MPDNDNIPPLFDPEAESAFEPAGVRPITLNEFNKIRMLVYKHSGINLSDKKRPLVMGRLHMTLRNLGFENFTQYIGYLESDKSGKAISVMVDRISTNHTYFYREESHFQFFQQKALPEITERAKKAGHYDLRIWSAGCATGEEPYMLAMLMMEHFGGPHPQWDAGVLATDISDDALATAIKGVYPEEKMNVLPPFLKAKYFVRDKEREGFYKVDKRIQAEVTFRKFNFMTPVFPFKKKFDIIFCRNVMIYFDQEVRETLVGKFYDNLATGGYFFIGHSETLRHYQGGFKYIMPALYQKID